MSYPCARPECDHMIPEPAVRPGRRREFCSNTCRTVTWNRKHREQRRAARLRREQRNRAQNERRLAQRLERDRLWHEAMAALGEAGP